MGDMGVRVEGAKGQKGALAASYQWYPAKRRQIGFAKPQAVEESGLWF